MPLCPAACWSRAALLVFTGNSLTSFPSRIGILSMFSFSEIDESGMLFCCIARDVDEGTGVVMMVGGGPCADVAIDSTARDWLSRC